MKKYKESKFELYFFVLENMLVRRHGRKIRRKDLYVVKYLKADVWNLEKREVLIYLKAKNKRTVRQIRVRVSTGGHYCFSCPYFSKCSRLCYELEIMWELIDFVREEFNIWYGFEITPLGYNKV